MQPEIIVIASELLCMLVLIRLCIVLLGKRKGYRDWEQRKKSEEIREGYK